MAAAAARCAHSQSQRPLEQRQQHRQRRAAAAARRRVLVCRAAKQQQQTQSTPFPSDYNAAVRQAQSAVQAALADGATLIEVEFPTASLAAVAGDAEGANEMTYSLQYLRQFMRAWQQEAATTRIFFPDQKEMQVALQGKAMDPSAGSWKL